MTSFLIAARPRSGSHLLRDCLEKHPDVRCMDECFNRKSVQNSGKSAEQWFSEIFAEPKKCSGFILHYDNARQGKYAEVRAMMKSRDVDYRVLRMHRKDLFAMYVSKVQAIAKGKWTLWDDEERVPDDVKFEININDMFQYFVNTHNAFMTDLCEIYVQQPVLPVAYEDMVESLDSTMSDVWEFLGLKHVRVKPRTVKQVRKPINQLVENYWDCVEAIRRVADWKFLLQYKPRWEKAPESV